MTAFAQSRKGAPAEIMPMDLRSIPTHAVVVLRSAAAPRSTSDDAAGSVSHVGSMVNTRSAHACAPTAYLRVDGAHQRYSN